jgi:hypothetical protein
MKEAIRAGLRTWAPREEARSSPPSSALPFLFPSPFLLEVPSSSSRFRDKVTASTMKAPMKPRAHVSKDGSPELARDRASTCRRDLSRPHCSIRVFLGVCRAANEDPRRLLIGDLSRLSSCPSLPTPLASRLARLGVDTRERPFITYAAWMVSSTQRFLDNLSHVFAVARSRCRRRRPVAFARTK